MVVFTCNHCGDSVQKPNVQKHYSFVCRKFKDLTCIDCLKDFRGEEYAAHTKCLTEEERYAAKGSIPNGIQKKGEVKQELWIEMIKSIICSNLNIKSHQKKLLLTISKYNNVPRKKKKFINYIKSATGARISDNVIIEVWDIIEKYKENQANSDATDNEKNETHTNEKLENDEELKENFNGKTNSTEEKTRKKKREQDSVASVNEEDSEVYAYENSITEKKAKKKKRKYTDVNESENTLNTLNDNTLVFAELRNNDAKEKIPKKNKNQDRDYNRKTNVTEVTEDIYNDDTDHNASNNGEEEKQLSAMEYSISNTKNKGKGKKTKMIENRYADSNMEKLNENHQESNNSFSIEDAIIYILNKKSQLSLKVLEKKVRNKYLKYSQETEVPKKIVKKFYKKVKKSGLCEINDKIVRLKQ